MCEKGTEDRTGCRRWTGLRAAHISRRRLSKYQLHMDVGKCPRGPPNSTAGSLAREQRLTLSFIVLETK